MMTMPKFIHKVQSIAEKVSSKEKLLAKAKKHKQDSVVIPDFIPAHAMEKKKKSTKVGPCYQSHKPLPLGDGLSIIGGAASDPVAGCDIYVSFDAGKTTDPLAYPWNQDKGTFIYFYVQDYSVPKDPKEYINLVQWIAQKIKEGKKVHAGCIAGHGRTGMFLAALAKTMLGIEDAITYVRDNYCSKVVESEEQVAFLHKHFGIKKVKGAKEWGGGWDNDSTTTLNYSGVTTTSYFNDKYPEHFKDVAFEVSPIPFAFNVWGMPAKLS